MTGTTSRLRGVPRDHGTDGDTPLVIDRGSAREAAERELSDPAYQENEPGLLRQALDWVLERLGELLSSAAGVTPGGWFGLLVVSVLAVLLVLALRLRLGSVRGALGTGPAALFDERPDSASAHRRAAEQHAAAEHWAEAVQERMRALVRELEDRDLLDHHPGRTADEAAAEAGRVLPAHADRLQAAARAFDEVTYAGRASDPEAYRALADLDTALRSAKPAVASEAGAPS